MRRDATPYRSVPLDPPAAETGPPAEVHCLAAEDGAGDGELLDEPIIVDSSGLKIGRTAPADIILAHKSVSREHCLLGLANDELFVTDLNSTNGTFIDDARITRATILPVGSLLRVGQVSLRHSIQLGAQGSRAGDSRRPAGRLAASS
jgi:pSer/pThr/pTyr-binding forkhead associated (FHA) protein